MDVCVSVCPSVYARSYLRIYSTDLNKIWSPRVFHEYLQAFFLFSVHRTYVKNEHFGIWVISGKTLVLGPPIQSKMLTSKLYILQGCHVWATPQKSAISNNFYLGIYWTDWAVFLIFVITVFLGLPPYKKKVVFQNFSKTTL